MAFIRRSEYEYPGYSDRNCRLFSHMYSDRFLCRQRRQKALSRGGPSDIQEEYFKTHERIDVSCKSKNVILTKGSGVLLFTCILPVCSLIAIAKTFWQSFGLTFGLMAWISIYDTCFLDWVLSADVPTGGYRAYGQSLSPEVVPREGHAVSRHHLRTDPCRFGGWIVTLIR